MKIEARLAGLEKKLLPRPSASPRPLVLFESHPTDPTLFLGPDGILLTDEQVTAYQTASGCRVVQVMLDRNWPEDSA